MCKNTPSPSPCGSTCRKENFACREANFKFGRPVGKWTPYVPSPSVHRERQLSVFYLQSRTRYRRSPRKENFVCRKANFVFKRCCRIANFIAFENCAQRRRVTRAQQKPFVKGSAARRLGSCAQVLKHYIVLLYCALLVSL